MRETVNVIQIKKLRLQKIKTNIVNEKKITIYRFINCF